MIVMVKLMILKKNQEKIYSCSECDKIFLDKRELSINLIERVFSTT